MLKRYPTLAQTRDNFRWDIPAHYNIGVDICDKHADLAPGQCAIVDIDVDGQATEYSFAQLRDRSNQLANALSQTCTPGDRVAVLLPQCFETAVAHVAITKMGCISLPLFTLFGPEALLHRLKDSGAHTLITNAASAAIIAPLKSQLTDLKRIICIDGTASGAEDFPALCASPPSAFTPFFFFYD